MKIFLTVALVAFAAFVSFALIFFNLLVGVCRVLTTKLVALVRRDRVAQVRRVDFPSEQRVRLRRDDVVVDV